MFCWKIHAKGREVMIDLHKRVIYRLLELPPVMGVKCFIIPKSLFYI